ncbi:MAG: hypothetical protein GXX10_06695 [Clostridiaceae bacterium]|nr:hypothetical protein [Clostridiaceae bacterium]
MLDEMISLRELLILIVSVLGSLLIVYLIMALSNLIKALRNINDIIEENKDDIRMSVVKLPEITDNAAKITGMVKDNLESIQHVIDDVGKISDAVKNGVETIQKDILLKVKTILDIIDAIRKQFVNRKEKSKKKNTVYKYKYKPGQDKPEEIEIVTSEDEDFKPDADYVKVEAEGVTGQKIDLTPKEG